MRDFTVEMYGALVSAFARSYSLLRVDEYVKGGADLPARTAIFRHDVDRDVKATVRCAEVMADMRAGGTFYFRYPYTFRPEIMRRVHGLGHEVGYHYEVLTKSRGDIPRALTLFEEELDAMRAVCPVQTACMHGAPLSRWDNRDIWKESHPSHFGLIAEPYITMDFSRMLYVTDTGRTWANRSISVRDRVSLSLTHSLRSTPDLIAGAESGVLADRVMLTVHPERWAATLGGWMAQLVVQSSKNVVKALLVRVRS